MTTQTITQIGFEEVKRDVAALFQRIEAGEMFVVLKAGQPVAEIKPVSVAQAQLRPFGLCAGEFKVPDDFDAPLPESIIKEFEGR